MSTERRYQAVKPHKMTLSNIALSIHLKDIVPKHVPLGVRAVAG